MAKTKKNEEISESAGTTVPTEMTKAQKNDFLASAISEAEEFTNTINLLVKEHQASLPAGVTLVASRAKRSTEIGLSSNRSDNPISLLNKTST